jgi:ketosteroid isomerase-like protein
MLLHFFLTLSVTAGQSSGEKEELIRLEEVWNKAHLEGDAATLERLWAEDLTVTVPRMAVMARADAVGVARSNRVQFTRYETSDLNVQVFDAAAVVKGRMKRSRSRGGQEVNDDWQFTKVYVKHAGDWKVVAFHASESPQ